MSAAVAETLPRPQARMAGLFWLLTFVTGALAMAFAGRFIVAGDAAATAANLLANERLFQAGAAANLIATCCYLAATLFVYELLAPVNRSISLLAAFFSLTGSAVGAISGVLDMAPLALLKSAPLAKVFTTEQLQALALLSLDLRAKAGNIGLVLFGLHCLLVGVLIYKSSFLPRAVGVLMMLAGIGWLTFVWPPLSSSLFPYNMLPGVIGEAALTLWLLVRGVNVQRWREQASPA